MTGKIPGGWLEEEAFLMALELWPEVCWDRVCVNVGGVELEGP